MIYGEVEFIPFREIAHKCMSGKLKGDFVLSDGTRISCDKLKYEGWSKKPFGLTMPDGSTWWYNQKGIVTTGLPHKQDVVDFIPSPPDSIPCPVCGRIMQPKYDQRSVRNGARITETQLMNIISESIKRVLKEHGI